MVNQKLKLIPAKQEYNTHNFIKLSNWLEDSYAQELKEYLQGIPMDWWSYRSSNSEHPQIILSEDNINLYETIKNEVVESLSPNVSSYSYHMVREGHSTTCNCLICNFKQFMASRSTFSLLSYLTGKYLVRSTPCSIAKYEEKDFLNPNTEEMEYSVKLFYSLSTLDSPFDGGLLFFNKKGEDLKVILPEFNTLYLFDSSFFEKGLYGITPVNFCSPEDRFSCSMNLFDVSFILKDI